MNCHFSTTDDILDFTSLAQEAVKVMERERRIQWLAHLARSVKYAKDYNSWISSSETRKAIKQAKFLFLSEV